MQICFKRRQKYSKKKGGGVILTHETNKGKGRALKTAFQYVLEHVPNAVGVVTADSDGQHTVACIQKIKQSLAETPKDFILGVRDFHGAGIPWKSRFGNQLTEKIFRYLTGVHIHDTQTGLRGIPRDFMQKLLGVRGERFEFEMRMLLKGAENYHIEEITIETIYDSKENHQTHFDPIGDSIKIYKILGGRFLKYIVSSFSASVLDLVLFSIFCFCLQGLVSQWYIVAATVAARLISAAYNYLMNYKLVFQSGASPGQAGVKYAILAILQMSASAALVTLFVRLTHVVPEVIIKGAVDTILFFLSYYVQQQYVFRKSSARNKAFR